MMFNRSKVRLSLILLAFALFLAASCGDDDNPVEPVETTVTDIDGNVYKTVKIGDQVWMAENLKVTHYRNGDTIPNVTDNLAWEILGTGAYCKYDNDSTNVAIYGRLYNWYAVDDSRNIAPEGWHVPSSVEWKQMEMYLGMSQAEVDSFNYGWTTFRGTDEGGKLKDSGTTYWAIPNIGATNESGFSALPGGCQRSMDYVYMGAKAYFWTSDGGGERAVNRVLSNDSPKIGIAEPGSVCGYSVRCVKD